MLWLVVDEASYQIRECNLHERDGVYQVWVERTNGKTLKVHESKNKQEVEEIKEAIDFAIENGERSLRLT